MGAMYRSWPPRPQASGNIPAVVVRVVSRIARRRSPLYSQIEPSLEVEVHVFPDVDLHIGSRLDVQVGQLGIVYTVPVRIAVMAAEINLGRESCLQVTSEVLDDKIPPRGLSSARD